MKPTVLLCMIVRDAQRNLSTGLRAVRHLVDEIVVIDPVSSAYNAAVARDWDTRVFELP